MAVSRSVAVCEEEKSEERQPRPQRLEASFLCSFRYQGRSHPCHLTDISDSGLFLEAAFLPSIGAHLIVTPSFLDSQQGTQFRISGLVKHVGRYLTADRNLTGFGLEIRKADQPALARLKALIDQSPGPAESKFGML